MSRDQRGIGLVQVVWTVTGIMVTVVAAMYIARTLRKQDVTFTTPYQAVLLTNGSVYFGKLNGYGSPHPVLTDVYYIVSQSNTETKQVNNVLIRRGHELHEPDRMYLNPNQILFVEPVGPHSQVAQKIAAAEQSAH
ncbi:MAG TPA: hypothetical protein VL523_12440 [Terriglobia bacterium]|nr:hypothetical protein [Terriglobia bacterium]